MAQMRQSELDDEETVSLATPERTLAPSVNREPCDYIRRQCSALCVSSRHRDMLVLFSVYRMLRTLATGQLVRLLFYLMLCLVLLTIVVSVGSVFRHGQHGTVVLRTECGGKSIR